MTRGRSGYRQKMTALPLSIQKPRTEATGAVARAHHAVILTRDDGALKIEPIPQILANF